MKQILTCAIASAFALASFAAQDKPAAASQSREVQTKEVKQETKTTTTEKAARTSADTLIGTVKSYEPGKSIEVTVPGTTVSTKSFDLTSKDVTVNVAPNVKVGESVSIVEKTDGKGHKTVTVKPSREKGASDAKKADHSQK